jgi:hypothetical protein
MDWVSRWEVQASEDSPAADSPANAPAFLTNCRRDSPFVRSDGIIDLVVESQKYWFPSHPAGSDSG